MKGAWITLCAAVVLLALFFSQVQLWFRKSAVDIHVHDTYFIVTYFTLVLFLLLFLGTFFTLGGAIGTAFQNKYFIVAFLFFACTDAYCIIKNLPMFR